MAKASCVVSRAQPAAIAASVLLFTASARAEAPAEGSATAADSPAGGSGATVEVHVFGDSMRAPVPNKDSSVAGSVVRGERLRAAGIQPADVLRTQPGVVVVESGAFGAPATASLRGATAADTPVYLAGVRLNDDVGGTADLSLVPLWLIDRVEIYRGNAPIEADRFSPGGAIFFEPKFPSRTTAGAGLMAGSYGARSGFSYFGFSEGPVSSVVGVSAEGAKNDYPYLNDSGTLLDRTHDSVARRENADVHTVDGWGLFRVDLGNGARVDVMANAISREQGVPSLALLPTREARSQTDRVLAAAVTEVPFGPDGRHLLQAKTSGTFSQAVYRDPLGELAFLGSEVRVSAHEVEQTLSSKLELSPWIVAHPSVLLADEHIDRSPNDIPLGRSRRFVARAAGLVEARASKFLTLRALASGECHATGASEGRFCDVLEPTGRLGIELGWPRAQVLVNAGRYVRVPTLGEVYGISGAVRGNPELTPETGLSAEAGVRARSRAAGELRGVYADAFAFVREADRLIAYKRVGQGYVIPYNVGRARVLGAEIMSGVALFSFLRAELAATLLDPRDTSPARTTVNDVLPYRSRLVLSPRLAAARAVSFGALSRVAGEVRYVYQSNRYTDPAGLGVVPEQGSMDAEVELDWLGGHLASRARIADLFDAKRTDIIGYPLPGRTAFFSLEATW